jgi:hypothetical protein
LSADVAAMRGLHTLFAAILPSVLQQGGGGKVGR